MKLSNARLLTGAAAALTMPLLLAPAALAQTAPWAVVASPNASPGNNQLAAVASITASGVWAVGSADNAAGNAQPLAEHWDGTAWRIVPSPSGAGPEAGLLGVAAVSTSDVWAVGDTGSNTLIEHWNGASWTVVPSPTPAGTLFNPLSGAAIVSATDIWAVGQSQNGTTGIPQTLIEQWNGTSWSIVPSPAPGTASLLSGASANPTSGQAWAVGNFRSASGATQTLTEFNP
jgi:hypothetical protein